MTWTDNRNVVPGSDPRELEEQGGFNDGFDVAQCLVDLGVTAADTVAKGVPRARADASPSNATAAGSDPSLPATTGTPTRSAHERSWASAAAR